MEDNQPMNDDEDGYQENRSVKAYENYGETHFGSTGCY